MRAGAFRRWFLASALALSPPCFAVERVVTLSPHLAELVCAAGGCSKLVGVVAYSDYPPEVTKLPQVGDAFNVNLERLLALKPDLILSWDGGGSTQTAGRLRELGLRVERLRVRKLDEIGDALRQIGRWLETSAVADRMAEDVRQGLGELSKRYGKRSRLKVFYQIQTDPFYTISGDSPISEAIALCGGDNAFSNLKQLAAPVSLEAVLAAKPDAVIYAVQDHPAGRDYWTRHPELPAAATGKVYSVDADLLARATPRMLEGIQQLCEVLEVARSSKRPSPPSAGAPR